MVAGPCPIDAVDSIIGRAARSDSTLNTFQRWCDAGWLATRRHEIVDDVLNEYTLTLAGGK